MYPLDIQSSLQRAFEENFASRDEIGASVSVWQNGKEIVTLSKGWSEREKIRPWGEQTLSPVYSVSKVPAATTFLLALRESGFSSNNLVRKVWPKLPVGDLTFAASLDWRSSRDRFLDWASKGEISSGCDSLSWSLYCSQRRAGFLCSYAD